MAKHPSTLPLPRLTDRTTDRRSHHAQQQGPARPARHLEQRPGHRARSQRHDPGDPGRAEAGQHDGYEGARGGVSEDQSAAVRQLRGGQRRVLELRDTVQHEGGKSPDRHGQDGPGLRSHGGGVSPAQGARDQGTQSGRRLRSATGKLLLFLASRRLDDSIVFIRWSRATRSPRSTWSASGRQTSSSRIGEKIHFD